MKKPLFLAVMLAPLLTTGCSTVFNGHYDTVTVSSHVSDAMISVDGDTIGMGNATFQAEKGKRYTITASKAGCQSAIATTDTRFEPSTLIGAPLIVPMMIDVANGNAWRVTQNTYILNPVCDRY
ncbi:hypothetical protein ACTG16_21890 [Aeromonas sp. 23P]|uniref:hypothetical protein n=1 Tax=Aeromonas sp. 23P TaxID=3452716 RepID=UPI003F7A3D0B|nr:hypothetical protein [Aeromonas veronii]